MYLPAEEGHAEDTAHAHHLFMDTCSWLPRLARHYAGESAANTCPTPKTIREFLAIQTQCPICNTCILERAITDSADNTQALCCPKVSCAYCSRRQADLGFAARRGLPTVTALVLPGPDPISNPDVRRRGAWKADVASRDSRHLSGSGQAPSLVRRKWKMGRVAKTVKGGTGRRSVVSRLEPPRERCESQRQHQVTSAADGGSVAKGIALAIGAMAQVSQIEFGLCGSPCGPCASRESLQQCYPALGQPRTATFLHLVSRV